LGDSREERREERWQSIAECVCEVIDEANARTGKAGTETWV
jgi:hypothetical protein